MEGRESPFHQFADAHGRAIGSLTHCHQPTPAAGAGVKAMLPRHHPPGNNGWEPPFTSRALTVFLPGFLGPRAGACAGTAGIGIDEKCKVFEVDRDDHHRITLNTLADGLAEGFAELLR